MRQETIEPIGAIAHPTDFSQASAEAFAHALRLAVEFRCKLTLIHVRSPGGGGERTSFPRVRETLIRWGLLPEGAGQPEVEEKLGVCVRKVKIERSDPLRGVADFLIAHRPGLVVMATHGPEGLNRWLAGSVSEGIAARTRIPALFIGRKARSFVDANTGRMHLKTIVVPVARHPSPEPALVLMHRLLGAVPATRRFVHVGDGPFELEDGGERLNVALLKGPVVESIVSAANTFLADLLVMPTAGKNGFLDALRGSTTEQVVQRAPCPVLALPD